MRSHSFYPLFALCALLAGAGRAQGQADNNATTVVIQATVTKCPSPPPPPPPCKTSSSSSSATSVSADTTTTTTTRSTVTTTVSGTSTAVPRPACTDFWLAKIKHQGLAPYAGSPSTYKVFRNVAEYGAVGDGVADDTAAINRAISDGGRCAPGVCNSTTTTPALVYFPPGTYLVTAPIVDYYFTQIHGNPDCMPVIRAAPGFTAPFVFDSNPYQPTGRLGWGATNVFWRQVRNLGFDLTAVRADLEVSAIHWPSSQATSLQNIHVRMSTDAATKHQGMLIEEGSGGFVGDLVFEGGRYGMAVGNQQFTMRNLTFVGARGAAIRQIWDWGWTYSGVHIRDCAVGLDISNVAADTNRTSVGSVVFIDSDIADTPIGVLTNRRSGGGGGGGNNPPQANSLVLENVALRNVPVAIQGPDDATLLAGPSGPGSASTIAGWGQGNRYTGTSPGPTGFQGPITPVSRPAGLTTPGGSPFYYYARSRPQYAEQPVSRFVSVRDEGARGDGVTDDTAVLNRVLAQAAAAGKIVFFDFGLYVVTSTLSVPPGSRIVGEALPVILSQGAFFNDMANPKPVVQVGDAPVGGAAAAASSSQHEKAVEWSDMVVSTRGQQAGAILIEWNLASATPSGMWDVHTRIGGFRGSDLQAAECPKTPDKVVTEVNLERRCIAAFMSMHVTRSAANLLNENCWLWVADHDVEDGAGLAQITVYAGRGLLVESTSPSVWLWGSGVEHHVLYEYQFSRARGVFAGQIQTETAYFQPNPDARVPFPADARFSDPVLAPGESGWALRAVDSADLLVYGAGLYSFFDNYNVSCAQEGNGQTCQRRIASVERSSGVVLYNLNTVGVRNQITVDGVDVARFEDNRNGFVNTVAIFTSE